MKVLRQYDDRTEAGGFTKNLAAWDERIARGLSEAAAARTEALRTRLAAISTPAQMQEVGRELSEREGKPGSGQPPGFPIGLGRQLTMVAAAWTSGTAPPDIRPSSDTRFSAELEVLETKVHREILAAALRVPQLNHPPLSALSLEEALDKLNVQMAQREDWRGLLSMIEARAKFGRLGALPQKDRDLPETLRAYFQGQNLELSEQWSEAQMAYRRVLHSTSELAPIKDTAERLKKVSKKVSAFPTPPSPTNPPASTAQ